MKSLSFVFAVFVTVAVNAASFAANTNADYAGLPPYVSASTVPNVLLLLDNSGSMAARAACEVYFGFVQISCPSNLYDPLTARLGMFDNLTCYTYDAGNGRFVADFLKGALDDLCPVTEWDGNLLNWIVTRRVDAVKQALIGGQCAVARLVADGTCPPIGAPPMITMTGQPVVGFTPGQQDSAHISAAQAVGRVPDAVRINGTTPDPLYFVLGIPSIPSFCVNDNENFFSCTAAAGFTPSSFPVQVGVDVEPTGSVQNLADKVRWAMMNFNNASPGGTVTVPMGQRQALNAQTGVWTTWPSNSQAMIQGVQAEFPQTATPLAESLYDASRYLAQLPSAENGGYVYPIAFAAGGAPFQDPAFGPGSMAGPAELKATTGAETCPAGYIANACGRDPFFFGSNHAPPWSLPSAVVPCCRTFILIMTDGFPQVDNNVPAAMQDLAHSAAGDLRGHQGHCSGPDSFTACAPAPPPFSAVGHKTDYPAAGHYIDDVAFWAHTTDLRPDNGNADPTKACNSAFGAIPTLTLTGETGHCLPGDQKPIIYTFFASFSISVGREPLMEAAKQGGFVDQNNDGSGPNGVNTPDLVSEWDSFDNATGVAVPDGIPDTYYEASNGDDLKNKLDQALTSILKRASSGTSVSTLASSSSGIGAVFQSYFFPAISTIGTPAGDGVTPEVDWTGYVQGLFVDQFGNLREDFSAPGCTGPPDGILIFKHDCIVKLRFDPSSNTVKVDRFKDLNEDGIADTVAPFQTVDLSTMQPMWEAGRRLALTTPGASCAANAGGVACRRILSWADVNNDGIVGSTPEFSVANKATFCPYLGGQLAAYCTDNANVTAANVLANTGFAAVGCTGPPRVDKRKDCALIETTNIITFIRGVQDPVAGYRNRLLNVTDDLGATVTTVWPLGDIMASSPVLVGAPAERFDVIYGDVNYATFFARYKDRRKVVYVGANDGMMHAFNAGYLVAGDDLSTPGITEQERFLTRPVQPGTSTPCATLPCDGSVTTYAYRGDTPKLGAELWAFIPQDLLPQLRWLTSNNYSHVYYVDLKPKITDARIFCNDQVAIASCIANSSHADHPGGWGTILIGGFRFGGSCKNCTQGHGGPRTVTADFGSGSQTRVFVSSYFVMDITNPEKDPTLLWVFRDQDMGLGTSQPAVVRIKPPNTLADPMTNPANEKWFVTFGSGPTNYDANSSQPAQMFAVDLMLGPRYLPSDLNKVVGTVRGTPCSVASPCLGTQQTGPNRVRLFPTGLTGAFMGDESTLDFDLDFRVDVIYAGSVKCTGATPSPCNGVGPVWQGAVWRLLTKGDTDPDNWGIRSGPDQKPTKLISTFTSGGTCPDTTVTCADKVGPVTAAPALSTDDTQNIWVYFGTGRYFSNLDKTNQDPQNFFGVKDCVITSPAACVDGDKEYHNLLDVSNIVVCTSCAPTANVSNDGGATFTVGFQAGGGNLVNNIQNMDGWVTNLPNVQERNFTQPTILGGTLFFTSFIPSNDLCISGGNGLLYALYYGTGTPYSTSTIGTSVSGGNTISNASLALGFGMPSQAAVQIGAQGSGAQGSTSNSGCVGRVTAFVQAGTGAINQFCTKPALQPWSRMISWRDL